MKPIGQQIRPERMRDGERTRTSSVEAKRTKWNREIAHSVDEGFEELLGRLVTHRRINARQERNTEPQSGLPSNRSCRSLTFFETGLFSHGTGFRGHSDIDALVRIGDDKPGSSYTALTWVKDAISAGPPSSTVKIRRPMVVRSSAAGMRRGR